LSFKSTKKFLKKNNLLQRDLFAFLSWRELQQRDLSSKDKTSNKKDGFSNFSFFNKKTLLCEKKKILRKHYRPNENKVLNFFSEKDQKRRIFGEFFPQKKVFLSFWVFPLLGGCFLNLLTLSQNENLNNKKFGFPNLETTNLATKYTLNSLFSKNDFQDDAFTKKFLTIPQAHTNEERGLTEKLSYVSFYKQPTPKSSLKLSLSSDLENLCRFYISLTSQTSKIQNENHWSIDKELFINVDTIMEKHNSLNNALKFDVLWYALRTDQSRLVGSNEDFPDKIKNENFISLSHNKETNSPLGLCSPKDLKVPHISYLEASKLMDRWITQLTENQIKKNNERNFQSSSEKPNFEYQQNIIEAIQSSKDFTKDQFNLINKKSLTFHVFEFFNCLQKNQKLLKNFSLALEVIPEKNNRIILIDSLSERLNFNEFSSQNSFLSKAVLQRMRSHYKYSLLKTFLTNHLYKEHKRIKKVQQSKENFLNLSQKISPFHKTKKIKNSSIELTDNKNSGFLKNLDFMQSYANKKKDFKFKLNNREIQNILKYTVFLKIFQKPNLLENKTEKILRKTLILNLENREKNINLKLVRVDLQKLSYELMLLNSWKKLLSNLLKFNYQPILINEQFYANRKQNGFLDSRESFFVNEMKSKKKTTHNFVDVFDKNLFKEVHLYTRLDKISKSLLELVFSLEKNNLSKTILEGSPFDKKKPIFKYKTPLLSGHVSLTNTSILDIALNKKNFYDVESKSRQFQSFYEKKMTRSPISWYELAPKQSEIPNLSIFSKNSILSNNDFLSFFHNVLKNFGSLNYKNSNQPERILRISKTFDQEQLKSYLRKLEFQKRKADSFFVLKEFKNSKAKKIFLLKMSSYKSLSSFKNRKKCFQEKLAINDQFPISKFKKRKAEKVFRAYLSTKYSSNIEKKPIRWPSILPILKKFRNVLKLKKNSQLNLNLNDRTLWTISFLKSSKPEKKISADLVFKNNKELNKNRKTFEKQASAKSERFLKKLLGYTNFLKKKECELKDSQLKRLEKKQFLQKKRRLKKLKLENRRRKKRKRFYPRPHFLRFELYNSFLKKRHSTKSIKNLQKTRTFDFSVQKQTETSFQNDFSKKSVIEKIDSDLLKQLIFRQKKQKWGNLTSHLLFAEKKQLKKITFDWKIPTYHQKEFYKISNETLTDFERLCWKSYWLRSNLTPYIRRVQENWKKMKEIETLKTSSKTFSLLLKDLMRYPFFEKQSFEFIENSDRFCIERAEQLNRRGLSYLNIKDTLDYSKIMNPKAGTFKTLENKAEYDRLLYERITQEIKNVKAQLNIDGQKQARSYKLGRQKLDKQRAKNSFYSLIFSGPRFLDPKVNTFSKPLGNLESSTKPFGDLPTLRLLWSCNKTNLWTFKETNLARELWSRYKHREQIKNNKTKKFIKKVFRFSSWNQKNVDTMSLNKGDQNRQKIQAFGGHVFEKNSRWHLHQLKRKFQNQTFENLKSAYNEKLENRAEKNKYLSTVLGTELPFAGTAEAWFEKGLELKPQKRRTHFWWSTQQNNPLERTLNFWLLSPKNSLNLRDFLKTNKNVFVDTNHQYNDEELNNTILGSGFWICCLILHLSIFFAIIRIPEIRSLFKFIFLLISKLVNSYLICLFTVYDLILNYKNRVDYLILKFASFKKNPYRFQNHNIYNRSPKLIDRSNSTNSRQKPNDSIFQFLLNYKELSAREGKQSLKIENNLTVNQNSLALGSPILFQSTISYRVLFRNFLDFSTRIHESSTAFLPLNTLISYSIAPSFGKIYSVRESSTLKKPETNNWFYAWYTGFLWNISSKFDRQLLKSKKRSSLDFNLQNNKYSFSEEFNSSQVLSGVQPQISIKKFVKKEKRKLSMVVESNIQLQSILALLTLYLTKAFMNSFYSCFSFFYQIIFKTIDIMESILLIFYRFFEKPAEVVVEWIADLFLVEWSSDVTSYIPEAFDTALWESTTKFSRSLQISNGPLLGFFVRKIFLSCLENFYSWLLRPEVDLTVRQKKGIVFWDIWAEILIQAAEQYKMNLSSLSTIKEEQELLIENILENKELESETKKSTRGDIKPNKISSTNTNFLSSEILTASLVKMSPLTGILNSYPGEFFNKKFSLVKENSMKALNNPYEFYDKEIKLLNSTFIEQGGLENFDLLQKTNLDNSWKRWSVNQFLNTQGRDTDLFMDIHPSKSFSNVKFLKSYSSAQEILGSIVCDVYSGLFNKKVSKNILIVGAAGTAKTVFVQALAGETELKIVTENSTRYSIIQGGIPIGMKLLRDVFDSIAMHTPCLFLLEDIHVIGERRPMLISDDDNSKANDTSFGAEQEEVHEKNKLIYQSSRHSISHYKKPYKGDFSLSSPTNYFCYDFFLGSPAPRKRVSELTTRSPLSVIQLENAISATDSSNVKMTQAKPNAFLSILEISAEQIFAPPATSPFTILLMKEQKKLKPKKLVKQLPWSGISYDQSMLISKSNYAVRSKVALLAEIAMNNLSIKLDMITDLLVIIDSVRSNRGFVVFATTHLPSVLDPALRRPGRLDETLSLPFLPNLSSRFEILKTSLASCQQNLDLFDYSLFTGKYKQDENLISSTISQSLLLLLNSKGSKKAIVSNSLKTTTAVCGKNFLFDFPIYSIPQALRSTLRLDFVGLDLKKHLKSIDNVLHKNIENSKKSSASKVVRKSNSDLFFFLNSSKLNVSFSGNDRLNFVAYTYGQAGQFLAESLIIKDQTTYTRKIFNENLKPGESNTEEQILKILYSSKIQANVLILKLFAGKFAEFFALNNDFYNSFNRFQGSIDSRPKKIGESITSVDKLAFVSFDKEISKQLKEYSFRKRGWWLDKNSLIQVNPAQSSLSDNLLNFQNYWQSATSFLESLIQKRYLNAKNSVVSKSLLFEDRMGLRESLSPPNSLILTPARKFESYKRTLRDFIQKPMLTINEKLQMHQKQRFLKLLYKVPVQTNFNNISRKNLPGTNLPNKTNSDFYNSYKELSYLDILTLKPTSSFYYYKNDLLTRHRFSFLNQWWNGQLAEHNVETTYLSHVDWRSMFIESLGDVSLDFPDAEQFYNPKSRRWFLNSKSWEYWQSFEKISRTTIAQHCIFSCFTTISSHLTTNREFFDYLGFRFLRYHNVQEIDLLNFSVRFYKTQQILIS
jgi:SpoVK/Ycf46/Vps4 family AAA+-type ATPase